MAALNITGKMLGESQCEECPGGTECPDVTTTLQELRLSSGYWRGSWKTRTPLKCPRGGLCSGGTNPGGTTGGYCIANHRGPYWCVCFVFARLVVLIQCCCAICSMICDPDYFIAGGLCMSCSDASLNSPASVATIAGAAVLLAACVLFRASALFRKKVTALPWRSIIVKGKIVVIFFQIAMLIPDVYGIPFPSVYLGLLDVFQFMNINVIEVFHLQCIDGSWNFHSSLTFAVVVPLSIGICMRAYVAFAGLMLTPKRHKALKETSLKWYLIFLYCAYPSKFAFLYCLYHPGAYCMIYDSCLELHLRYIQL
jgi:hypothetical protein